MSKHQHKRQGVWRLALAAATALVVPAAGCAFGTLARPLEPVGATDHRRQGREHKQEASAHRAMYEPTARASSPLPFGLAVVPNINSGSSDIGRYEAGYSMHEYNPTSRHLDHAAEHQTHASEHYAAAQALEEYTDARCHTFGPTERTQCPLIGAVAAVEAVANGVRLRLAPGVSMSATVAHMQCHHAFATEQPTDGDLRCPLYLQNLEFLSGEDGHSVIVRSENPDVVVQFRRRSEATVGTAPRSDERATASPRR